MARSDIKTCDGMRKDGTCGNGYNVENHNKKCVGVNCPHRFGEYVNRNARGSIVAGGYIQPCKVQPANVPTRKEILDYKQRVSEQYRTVCEKTGEFFREVVKFGALLNEVEGFIGEGRGRGESDGLKAWLAENCPDVNYNTAKGYKAMAAKCAKMIGGGVQALACLQGRNEVVEPGTRDVVDVDASFIEKRDALFNEVDSRRKLEQMWFEFLGAQRKPGRPAGTGPFPASGLKSLTKESAVDGMFANLTKLKLAMDKHRAVLMKYAEALKARHPNECADFAQVAQDYAKCFA